MPYKDPARRREYMRHFARRKRARRKAELIDGRGCVDCGNDDVRVLEFHHRDPDEKTETIGAMLYSRPWGDILAEAAKCDLVCANCHAIRHW